MAQLNAIWWSLKRGDVFPVTVGSAFSVLLGRGSLVETACLRRPIQQNLVMRKLEEAELPVHIVVTNMSVAATVFLRDPAVEVVLAIAA